MVTRRLYAVGMCIGACVRTIMLNGEKGNFSIYIKMCNGILKQIEINKLYIFGSFSVFNLKWYIHGTTDSLACRRHSVNE